MAVTELARMLFAANMILESASSAVGLSKKGAIALAILHLEDGPEAAMYNQDLQDRFVRHSVSTSASAAKDTSAAKSELLKNNYIEVRDSVSRFRLTEKGREVALRMRDALNTALDEMRLTNKERSAFREILATPNPAPHHLQSAAAKPPGSVKSGRVARG